MNMAGSTDINKNKDKINNNNNNNRHKHRHHYHHRRRHLSKWRELMLVHVSIFLIISTAKAAPSGSCTRPKSGELQEYCWQAFVASCPSDSINSHNHHHHHHLLPPSSSSSSSSSPSSSSSSSSPAASPLVGEGLAEEYVVLMNRAYYGRMRQKRCLERNYFIGCSQDVLSFFDRRCSGRNRCTVEIPNTELHKMQPCPKDLMAYLEAEYECVKVFKAADVTTCHVPVSFELSSNQGFLIDHVAGSYACAFIIGAQSGQRINVTLYDFHVSTGHVEHGGPGRNKMAADGKFSSCDHLTYGSVNELDRKSGSDWSRDSMKAEMEVLICGGGDKRERFVYMSRSSDVMVVLTNQNNIIDDGDKYDIMTSSSMTVGPRFVIKFQAVGCGDLTPPNGGWVVRSGDNAVVYCNNSADVWHLVCNKNTWIGSYNNCSHFAKSYPGDSLAHAVNSYPVGVFVAVTIGIALGVFSGLVLLTIVICFQKRSNHSQRTFKDYDVPPNMTANLSPTLIDSRNKTHIILADKFYYDVTNSPANVCPCAIGLDSNLDPSRHIARDDAIGQTRLTSCENLLADSPCLSYRQPLSKRHVQTELRPPLISVLQTSVGGVVRSDVVMGCEVANDGDVILECKPYGKLANTTNNNNNNNNSTNICNSGR